jgi:NADH-quinone oxidoreductase subunit L
MTAPLVILAFFALTYGWVGIPEHFPLLGGLIPNWFHEFVGGPLLEHPAAVDFNMIPLLTSRVVALGGLWAGWTVYQRVKSVDSVDPLKSALGGFHTVLKNKYYIDEFYGKVFVRPAEWLAATFTSLWMDRTVIDGFLHAIAASTLQIGSALRNYFDAPIINGFGDKVGEGAKKLGQVLRPIQTGRIQQYMILALVSVAAFSALFYYLLVCIR